MGHFEKDDLLDVIRHEMRLDDDDGPGICSSTLLNVTRRAKYGGLPLDFHRLEDFDDSSDCYDTVYEIPLYEEPLHTRTIINEHLEQRTEQKILEEKRVEDNTFKGDINELFIRQDIVFVKKEYPANYKSVIDIYLEKNAGCLSNPLGEYSQFAATMNSPSKEILIIFPNQQDRATFRSLQISVTCTARVRDVIGYCMLQYFLEYNENLPGEVDQYHLHLAENDGEIEYDLPPLDRSKLIGQLGFDCLGIVGAQKKAGSKKNAVIVHFLDKDNYVIEVDSMEKPLKWLRDEAMRRREERMANEVEEDDGLIKINEYYMETVDNFDVRLDLENTISSARSLEFVMIRKNSSRAGFHPRGARYGRQMSAMMTLKMPNSPIPAGPMTPLPVVIEHSELMATGDNRPLSLSSPTVTWSDGGGQLSCFVVQRCHKYKPNWKAKLFIYWTRFEIDKFSVDKNAFLPQGYQKKTSVPWEYVGGVQVTQKETKPGRIDIWQITIFWLPVLDEETIGRVVGDGGEWTLQHVAKLYEFEEKWKSVVVETMKKEDVEQIESQMNSILNARDAAIYRTFIHSASGVRSPIQSAELAMMDCANAPIISPTLTSSESTKPIGKMRKMSKILLTPISAIRKKSTD